MRKKEHHPIYHLGKMHDAMMLFKPASIKDYKDSHQFSWKIQEYKIISTVDKYTYLLEDNTFRSMLQVL